MIPLQRFVPARFDGVAPRARGAAPAPNEHAAEILRELGLSAAEIERLREDKVIEPSLSAFDPPEARAAHTLPLEALLEQGSLLRIDAGYRRTLERALAVQAPPG